MTPDQYSVVLLDNRQSPALRVSATMIRPFPADQLDALEAAWASERRDLALRRDLDGDPIEHEHWDWRRKKERAAKGTTLLSAIVFGADVQGMIGIAAKPRPASLDPGVEAVYVDYLEVAPWNLGSSTESARYSGVGTVLMLEAVAVSVAIGCGGRVGLHSLPQAESFYAARGMTRLGPDPNYYDLVYFEYDGAVASESLARARRAI